MDDSRDRANWSPSNWNWWFEAEPELRKAVNSATADSSRWAQPSICSGVGLRSSWQAWSTAARAAASRSLAAAGMRLSVRRQCLGDDCPAGGFRIGSEAACLVFAGQSLHPLRPLGGIRSDGLRETAQGGRKLDAIA